MVKPEIISQQDCRQATVFLRFLAIFLITNSHLDKLYPYPQLGTGGALGNSLFFVLSGYGLALSWKSSNRSFSEWYSRRIERIYPSLILFVLIAELLLEGGWQRWVITDYIEQFIWPTPAWFISAIMIFYTFCFIILKYGERSWYVWGIMLLCIPYTYLYLTYVDLSYYSIEQTDFKWIFYLQTMLFGGYLAGKSDDLPKGRFRHLMLLIGVTLCYGFLGLLFVRGHYDQFQFIMHLLMFPLIYLLVILCNSPFVVHRIMNIRLVEPVIALLAGLTLEIYLLQGRIYSHHMIESMAFPFNIISFWVAVVGLAYCLMKMSGALKRGWSLVLHRVNTKFVW